MYLIKMLALGIAYKLLVNLYYWRSTTKLNEKYRIRLMNIKDSPASMAGEILYVLRRANIKNGAIGVVQSVGHNHLVRGEASLFDNLGSRDEKVIAMVSEGLLQAEGIFLYRAFQAINPIYWIELVVQAPIRLLQYVGFDSEKASVKLLGVFLNIVWVIGCSLVVVFRQELLTWLSTCIAVMAGQ